MKKGQSIRLADVFLIGPAMVWGGLALQRGKGRKRDVGGFLVAAGIGTVLFNAANYSRIKRKRKGRSDVER